MSDLKCLTTREVARLCRVSDATVKRWEGAGLLQSERTNGRHRRFRAEEVVRFQRAQSLGLKKSHGDESAVSAFARRPNKHSPGSPLFQALLAGCEEAATNVLINERSQGKTLAEIFDGSICPTLQRIGELWSEGELSISQEHLATRTVQNSIYKLRSILPVPRMNGNLAVCAAPESDFHELPTHLAQIIIESEGWEVLNFGANTPLKCLAKEISHYAPQAICISATIAGDLQSLVRNYKCLAERAGKLKIPIVLGGRVFRDDQVREDFRAEFYAQSFTELAELTRNSLARN